MEIRQVHWLFGRLAVAVAQHINYSQVIVCATWSQHINYSQVIVWLRVLLGRNTLTIVKSLCVLLVGNTLTIVTSLLWQQHINKSYNGCCVCYLVVRWHNTLTKVIRLLCVLTKVSGSWLLGDITLNYSHI